MQRELLEFMGWRFSPGFAFFQFAEGEGRQMAKWL